MKPELFKKLTEEVRAKIAEAMQSAEFKDFVEKTKAAEDTGTFEVVISTDYQDRQGEVIDQNGWDLAFFKSNPVVLWAHDYFSLPIGVCDEITKDGNQLKAKGRFAPAEANPFAQQVRRLYDAGVIRATSVGFIAHEVQGNVITKAELLEFSFVNVPANPHALSTRKAQELGLDLPMLAVKGIEVKAENEQTETPEQKPPEAPPAEETPPAPPTPPEKDGGKKAVKKDAEKIGALLAQLQSNVDNAIVETSKQILETIRSEYGEEEAKKFEKTLASIQFKQAIEFLKTAVVAVEETFKGSEAEESRDGGTPKQRSNNAGAESVIKEFDDYLATRQLLRGISTQVDKALERVNEKIRANRKSK